ncbi:CbiX/SirB N-terminal domain-containing protein [Xenophilus arseniciresistens]|uniref:CbiX/SirB N-terminal domain-containing protein n=1 Tax=Xenophilus arseniciresistens TaxID=1283306 RepID=A0AAE3T1P6_9BURK|nr:CbiX/SirB N-terminal domain-containing protein [Xenophilus arseniciresistens]MDA7417592.1 CbiX/SirB N-terminal domain-containing protein [Xenophilus arseniciresistens]
MTHAIVLLAHGSRDPQWREPVEAVARRIRELAPERPVRCAYLELATPDLQTAAAELVADEGARTLQVLPLFLGMGHHVREDLPRRVAQLQARFPDVPVRLRPAVGQHAWLLETLTRIALQDDSTPPGEEQP